VPLNKFSASFAGRNASQQKRSPALAGLASNQLHDRFGDRELLLPGALLVPVRAQLFPSFMFVDFGFPTFL
jgi:hypothetical protein